MDNSRRARRHLQRAQELLGFGYTDSSMYTMKFGVNEQEEKVAKMVSSENPEEINNPLDDLNADQLQIIVSDLGCDLGGFKKRIMFMDAYPRLWKDPLFSKIMIDFATCFSASEHEADELITFMTEDLPDFKEKVKTRISSGEDDRPPGNWRTALSSLETDLNIKLAKLNMVRLKSISEEEESRVLTESSKNRRAWQQDFDDYNKIPKEVQTPGGNIDIIVHVRHICLKYNTYSKIEWPKVSCKVHRDMNGNLRGIRLNKKPGDYIYFDIHNQGSDKEYWEHADYGGFHFTSVLPWEQIQQQLSSEVGRETNSLLR